MRSVLVASIGLGCFIRATRGEALEPFWAYGFTQRPAPGDKAAKTGPPTKDLRKNEPAEEQTRLRHIAGSPGAYSLVEIRYGANVVDWFPAEHPPLTPIMRNGPVQMGKMAMGCAFCHMPNGKGRPENAPVAGQSVGYLVRQLQDFREDRRTSADPRKGNTLFMIALAKAMTGEEIQATSHYFAALGWSQWIRVVETDFVPTTRTSVGMFVPTELARTEPIAGRIIEVPESVEDTELLRNPHSGFIAYVPPGSVEQGRVLATTGARPPPAGSAIAANATMCSACHGADLAGLGDVPGIAGRSPSYLARQLFDFQQGTRKGAASVLMKPVVANLSAEAITALAAYVASLAPPTTAALTGKSGGP